MNERIKELSKQAFDFVAKRNMCKKEYFWENIRHNRELQDSVDAKFAELIVQECVNVLHDNELWNRHISHALKEHFGVEE